PPLSLLRFFEGALDEPSGFPRRGFIHRRPRATQRFFDLLARLEQVGPGLLARLALERAGAAAHLALACADLLPPPLQPRGVVVLRRLPVRELPRFGFELARPPLDGRQPR